MAILLHCNSLTKSFGSRLLFQDISIAFAEGERIGLIGPNGSGKSTLMKVLAGVEPSDSGEITSKRNLRLAYLPQEDVFRPGATVEQVVTEALEDSHLDEHDRTTKVAILLTRIGFERFDQPAAELSGGWRKRLALARELIKDPELLILDEPTNHLDVEGIEWLEELLEAASFAYIVVSHDRYFLENVANRVVELNPAYPLGYLSITGDYGTFVEKREEFLEAQRSRQQALASRVRREVEWLRRGAKARTTKAKGRIDQAGRMMDELADLKGRNAPQGAAEVDFLASGRQTRKLLQFKKVAKTLGGRELFKNLDLVLAPGTRLGLIGPNGSGKTTLIRLMAGDLAPDTGTVVRADGLKVVRFDQSRQQLDRDLTLKSALSPKSDLVVFCGQSMHIVGWAGKFLFRKEQLDMPVSALSGGEQARVLIAQLMLLEADVLILDEPTNDLDIPTLEILEESLETFPGALVLVTHDRYMLDRLATDVLGLDGVGTASLYGDRLQYERARDAAKDAAQDAARAKAAAAKAQPTPGSTPPPKKDASKRLTWNEQRELESMEKTVLEAEAEAQAATAATADPKLAADHQKLHAAYDRMGKAQARVHELYERWQALEAKKAGN